MSLLIAFLIGVNLLGTAHAPRRRFAVAIALCAPLVIAGAFLGQVQMGVRVLLTVVGVLGMLNAWWCFRAQAEQYE